jgi:xanthine dehydrogenase iron-sulfur cluster and FAD-binding subunit A
MWDEYRCATSTDEVIQFLATKGGQARIVAGATDLILEIEHGLHKNVNSLIDISRIPGLDQIHLTKDDSIHLGPLVTHNHCVASNLIRYRAYPLARACWEVGAPQIRNRGTVAGNLITGSPANDTITALMALDARVVLKSVRGERTIRLGDFYTGVRKTILQTDEILTDIWFPAIKINQRGTFIKLALRRAQAISIVNVALLLTFEQSIIQSATITLGAVAPTIIHAKKAQDFLIGKNLADNEILTQAAFLAMESASPIDDIRASAAYRREMVRVITLRGLRSLLTQNEKDDFPLDPVLLWGKNSPPENPNTLAPSYFSDSPIKTSINGKNYSFKNAHQKTLLRLLREDAGLIGTKEGCAEGECGACTVFLDGKAVMACLVPAPRAHNAEIVTIEGISGIEKDQPLHPIQKAFIQEGAVQCGYCSPGFIMSAVKLIEERSHPTRNEIQQAITGNLCRCTGYYKIIKAIEETGNINKVEQKGLRG